MMKKTMMKMRRKRKKKFNHKRKQKQFYQMMTPIMMRKMMNMSLKLEKALTTMMKLI
jgi:nucleoside diphosphate kinase